MSALGPLTAQGNMVGSFLTIPMLCMRPLGLETGLDMLQNRAS